MHEINAQTHFRKRFEVFARQKVVKVATRANVCHVNVKCNGCRQEISVRGHQICVCVLWHQVTKVDEESAGEERLSNEEAHVNPYENFRCL